jgi:uncharacterized protein (TIGR02996 family)
MSDKPLRQALEEALAADPDDRGTHMAYADHLQEQGDPRGEFISVQLALEDPSIRGAERKRLRGREKVLLDEHARAWLGELAPYLLGEKPVSQYARKPEKGFGFQFRRGWLDYLELPVCTVDLARLLRRSPAARLLGGLVVHWAEDTPDDYDPGPDVPEGCEAGVPPALAGAPFLATLRLFQYGQTSSDDYEVVRQVAGGPHDPYNFPLPPNGETVAGLIPSMPRLEELYLLAHDVATDFYSLPTLGRLRVLQLYHCDPSPLADLAGNPALGKLSHLLLHPHSVWDEPPIRFEDVRALVRSPHLVGLRHLQLRLSDLGDAGVAEVVDSGILGRLEVLDLRHGTVTDEGARRLAACPDLGHLRRLDLQRNRLTAAGVAALAATGIARLDNQQEPGADGAYDDLYLYEGDVE